MCWDTLLEEQRLKKHQTLQQRVGIQRDLISKNDKLATELRRREEEERLQVCSVAKKKQFLLFGGLAWVQFPAAISFFCLIVFFSSFLIGFPLQKIEARKSSQKKLTEALRSHIDRSELNFPQKINIVDTCTLCIILL